MLQGWPRIRRVSLFSSPIGSHLGDEDNDIYEQHAGTPQTRNDLSSLASYTCSSPNIYRENLAWTPATVEHIPGQNPSDPL